MKTTNTIAGKLRVALGITGLLLAGTAAMAQDNSASQPKGPILAVTEIIAYKPMETRIYPNPAQDLVNVSLSNAASKEVKVQIINISGGFVFDKAYMPDNNDWSLQLNAGSLGNGAYIVRLICNEQIVGQKMLMIG